MSFAGIVLLIAMLLIVVAIIALPYILPGRVTGLPAPPTALEMTNAEYQAALITLRDLESDYQTGKLTESDYRQQRERQMTLAADLLRQIEALQSGTNAERQARQEHR